MSGVQVLLHLDWRNELWIFVQVFMVPIILTGFAAESFLPLPVMMLALFKFGFPESMCSFFTALDRSVDAFQRVYEALNFSGTMVHHFGALILFSASANGLVRARDCIVALPLVAQHAASMYC